MALTLRGLLGETPVDSSRAGLRPIAATKREANIRLRGRALHTVRIWPARGLFAAALVALADAVMRRRISRRGDAVGARADLAQATTHLLGPAGQMVPLVDVRTAIDLLSDAERVMLYARLLDADTDLQDALGLNSQRTRARARELMREVVARGGELSDELHAFAAELAQRPAVGRTNPG